MMCWSRSPSSAWALGMPGPIALHTEGELRGRIPALVLLADSSAGLIPLEQVVLVLECWSVSLLATVSMSMRLSVGRQGLYRCSFTPANMVFLGSSGMRTAGAA